MVSQLIILFLSILILYNFSNFFNISYLKCLIIFIWHTLFCFLFLFYSQNNVSDAITYYNWAINFDYDFRIGAMAVVNFNELFIDYLNFDYIDLTYFTILLAV